MKGKILAILSIVIGVLLVAGALAGSAMKPQTGSAGKNLKWTLDFKGDLTVTGKGAVKNLSPEKLGIDQKVRRVIVSDGVTALGGDLSICPKLRELVLGANVENVGVLFGEKLPMFERVTVAEENSVFMSEDGVLYNKEQTSLLFYPPLKKGEAFTVPETVQELRDGAFRGAQRLTAVTLPSSVTSIGANAFSGCEQLQKIYFGGSEAQWKELTEGKDLGLPDAAAVEFKK